MLTPIENRVAAAEYLGDPRVRVVGQFAEDVHPDLAGGHERPAPALADELVDLTAVDEELALAVRIVAAEPRGEGPRRDVETEEPELAVVDARIRYRAASLFHDVEPAARMGMRCVWINRLGERSDLPRAGELPDLAGLPDLLDALEPA